MSFENPFNNLLKNILVAILKSPSLWRMINDKENHSLTYRFFSKPKSFPRPRGVIL